MLSEAAKRELEGELDQLRNRYKRMGETIKALETVLNAAADVGFSQAVGGMPNATLETSQGAEPFNVEPLNLQEQAKGLREFMKTVFAQHPDGLKASEIIAEVMAMGYEQNGKTTVPSLVHGDLSRLKRQGKIRKEGAKYIWPPSAERRPVVEQIKGSDPVDIEPKQSVAEAAIAYMSEHGGRAHGRDILRTLKAKGYFRNSKSPASQLTNAMKKNKRIKRDLSAPNTWMLVEHIEKAVLEHGLL